MSSVDPTLPLYEQLRSHIRSRIGSGELRPLQKLPSERELSEAWSVSRMTIRHALSLLAQEGLVYSRPGKGVFVSPPKSELQLVFTLTGYSELLVTLPSSVRARLLHKELILGEGELMATFGFHVPEDLVLIARLRCLDDTPIAHHTMYFPHRLCPGLLDADLPLEGSVVDAIRSRYHLDADRVQQTIQARAATPEDAALLTIDEGAPVLYLERRTYLEHGGMIEFSRSTYRGDALSLQLSLDVSHWQ